MSFTVEDAKRVQRDLGLGDVHVFYVEDDLAPNGCFVIAHTDAERASGTNLRDCYLHRLLCNGGWDGLTPGWWSYDKGRVQRRGITWAQVVVVPDMPLR